MTITKYDYDLGRLVYPGATRSSACPHGWTERCPHCMGGEINRLRAELPQSSKHPLDFFTNVDAWGAAEWFDRMAKAIREQDAAVLAKDDMAFETYRNIAASSAMRLVREYEPYVRAALAITRPDRNPTASSPGGSVPSQRLPE